MTLGNTFLEIGVHTAVALPEVEWLEPSFRNYNHPVEEPVKIQVGWAIAPDRLEHGLRLSEAAPRDWQCPLRLPASESPPDRLS